VKECSAWNPPPGCPRPLHLACPCKDVHCHWLTSRLRGQWPFGFPGVASDWRTAAWINAPPFVAGNHSANRPSSCCSGHKALGEARATTDLVLAFGVGFSRFSKSLPLNGPSRPLFVVARFGPKRFRHSELKPIGSSFVGALLFAVCSLVCDGVFRQGVTIGAGSADCCDILAHCAQSV